MKVNVQKLRILYTDIIRGFSIIEVPKYGRIYIKHPNHIDSALVDSKTEYYLEKARDKKLPTLSEKEEYLEKEGLWTKKENSKLSELEYYLKNLYVTKSKCLLRAEREAVQKTIDENEQVIIKMRREKAELIGFTAELYAGKKANEYYMYNSVYRDQSFKTHFFTHEEFTELEDFDLNMLVSRYNESQNEFNGENIKRIAVSSFFTNLFYLCEDRVIDFYGKPVVDLTFNQAELFSYGRYFKHILSEHRANIPQHLAENPDGIIDWYERNKNAQKIMNNGKNKDGGMSTIVGATKEDLEDLGYKHNVVDLSKEASKKGGSLSMDDLIALQGA